MQRCVEALVSGRVQGVCYRRSTQQQAEALGVTGHARNLPDGRVEVLACGEAGAVQALLDWLHAGPAEARVSQVETRDITLTPPERFTTG